MDKLVDFISCNLEDFRLRLMMCKESHDFILVAHGGKLDEGLYDGIDDKPVTDRASVTEMIDRHYPGSGCTVFACVCYSGVLAAPASRRRPYGQVSLSRRNSTELFGRSWQKFFLASRLRLTGKTISWRPPILLARHAQKAPVCTSTSTNEKRLPKTYHADSSFGLSIL